MVEKVLFSMQWLKKFKRVVTVWAQIRFWSGLRLALSFTSLSHILIMGVRKYTWRLICPFCNTEKGVIRQLVEESFLLILGRQKSEWHISFYDIFGWHLFYWTLWSWPLRSQKGQQLWQLHCTSTSCLGPKLWQIHYVYYLLFAKQETLANIIIPSQSND